MVENVIETVEVGGTFIVDQRVNKINSTQFARRSTDVKSVEPKIGELAYFRPFEQHLGRNVDITI